MVKKQSYLSHLVKKKPKPMKLKEAQFQCGSVEFCFYYCQVTAAYLLSIYIEVQCMTVFAVYPDNQYNATSTSLH